MQAKYAFLNMPFSDWENYLEIKRNYDREKILEDHLKPVTPYVLVNHNFGSINYRYLNNKRAIDSKKNSITMDYLGFDNIFDWIGMIERAEEIHTVDTVWCYLLHKMGIKNVTVYSRDPGNENFFRYAREIFNKNWIYIL
jgi:hypothetical protein